MRVLIAFDKFKDSVAAAAACAIAARAIASARPGWVVDTCPLSDGGEGFAEILTHAAGGNLTLLPATGPRGGKVDTAFGIVSTDGIPPGARALMGPAMRGPVAVVEMAAASGLELLAPAMRDPTRASTFGTGEVLRAAAGAGAGTILLGVGGSATHDLGLGAVGALGVRFSGAAGEALDPLVPADWPFLRSIGGSIPERFPPILIACDVDNPLLGPRGALAVFGRQKGLRAEDEDALEAESARVAAMVCAQFGRPRELANLPGAGAAGGIAFGLMAAAGARLLPGFPLVSAWLDLERKMATADIVITGEGRFDDSSLGGKGPGSAVRRALALGKVVHVFAGQVSLSGSIPGLIAHAVTPPGMALAEALERAPGLLSESVGRAVSEA